MLRCGGVAANTKSMNFEKFPAYRQGWRYEADAGDGGKKKAYSECRQNGKPAIVIRKDHIAMLSPATDAERVYQAGGTCYNNGLLSDGFPHVKANGLRNFYYFKD